MARQLSRMRAVQFRAAPRLTTSLAMTRQRTSECGEAQRGRNTNNPQRLDQHGAQGDRTRYSNPTCEEDPARILPTFPGRYFPNWATANIACAFCHGTQIPQSRSKHCQMHPPFPVISTVSATETTATTAMPPPNALVGYSQGFALRMQRRNLSQSAQQQCRRLCIRALSDLHPSTAGPRAFGLLRLCLSRNSPRHATRNVARFHNSSPWHTIVFKCLARATPAYAPRVPGAHRSLGLSHKQFCAVRETTG